MTLAKAGNLIIERTPATTVRRQMKGPTIYNTVVLCAKAGMPAGMLATRGMQEAAESRAKS